MLLAQRRDYHQTIAYAGVMELGGWRSVAVPSALVFVHRTPDRVFAKMQRPRRIDVPALLQLRAAQGIDELIIEPGLEMQLVRGVGEISTMTYRHDAHADYASALASAGMEPVDGRWSNTKTQVLELHETQDALLAALGRKPRWEGKQAYPPELRYHACTFDEASASEIAEIDALHERWATERGHSTYDDHFLSSIRRCFGAAGGLVTVRDDRELLAALYVLIVDRVANYFYLFSAPAVRDGFAGTGMVLEAARFARARGCDLLDLGGCWDERYPEINAEWRGFSAFKEKFASSEVYYPPPFRLL
jgi:hypothetical protein